MGSSGDIRSSEYKDLMLGVEKIASLLDFLYNLDVKSSWRSQSNHFAHRVVLASKLIRISTEQKQQQDQLLDT